MDPRQHRRERRRSQGEDDEDQPKGPTKPIEIPINSPSSEEDSGFSVPESPNEKTLREVMARSPWTASPSPSGHNNQLEDRRGRANSHEKDNDFKKHNRHGDNDRKRNRSKSKEKVKFIIPKDQRHGKQISIDDDLDEFDSRFYQVPESAKYRKDTVTTRNLQQQIYNLVKVQDLHQTQIQQLERTVHEIQKNAKSPDNQKPADPIVNTKEEKKVAEDKSVVPSPNPTILIEQPNPVVAAIKTTEKTTENVIETQKGEKLTEVAVKTEEKNEISVTTAAAVPIENKTTSVTKVETTTNAAVDTNTNATIIDKNTKVETAVTSSVAVPVPVVVKDIVIPTPETSRTGRMRFASWNIEWFDQLIEEQSDGTYTIIRQSRNEGITDGDDLSKRIAAMIKELDPDVMGIQEGPANVEKLKFWIKIYLNDEFDCFGGIDGDHQRIYILVKKNGAVTDAKIHVASNEFLSKKWEFDVSGQFKLESYGFTRRPVVVQAEITLPGNVKQPLFFIALHLKSKHVGEGEELWRSLEHEKQQEYIRKAVKTRRRIASECARVRKCIDSVIFARVKDAMVLVAGDLNDGPGMDFFEEYYLLFDSVEILMGSPFYSKKLLSALLNEKSNLPDDQLYSVVFDDFVDRVSEKKCLLDHIFISPNMNDHVTRCGIAHGLYAKYSKAPQGLGKRQDRDDLPSFATAREGIESGAPFQLSSNEFDLTEFTNEEKIIVRDALMHGTYLRLIINSDEEIRFFGELLLLHKKLDYLVLHFEYANQEGLDNFAECLKQTNIANFMLSRSGQTTGDLCKVFDALKQINSLTHAFLTINLLPTEEMSFSEILLNEGIEELELVRGSNNDNGVELKDATWARIGELLSRHPSLKTLQCELLTPAACASLGSALRTNTAIKTLIIRNSVIHTEGMMHICEGLKKNSTLYDFEIPGDSVPSKTKQLFFEALANDEIHVKTLNLMSEPLDMDCIIALSEALKTNTVLERLDLTETGLDADTCQVLCHGLKLNKGLRTLVLCDNNIGVAGVQEISLLLQKNTPLQYLDLSQCINNEEKLHVLAEGLRHNRTLKKLYIHQNDVGSTGCAYICDVVKTHPTLDALDLSYNPNLGPEGLLSIKNMMIENTVLRELDITDSFQSSDELAQIFEALKTNQSLTCLRAYSSEGIMHPDSEEKIIAVLQDNYALTEFQTDGSQVNDKLINLLQRNSNMKSEIACKVAILSYNIARSKEAMALLPRELWIGIMKQIRHPGIPSFDIIDKAFSTA